MAICKCKHKGVCQCMCVCLWHASSDGKSSGLVRGRRFESSHLGSVVGLPSLRSFYSRSHCLICAIFTSIFLSLRLPLCALSAFQLGVSIILPVAQCCPDRPSSSIMALGVSLEPFPLGLARIATIITCVLLVGSVVMAIVR